MLGQGPTAWEDLWLVMTKVGEKLRWNPSLFTGHLGCGQGLCGEAQGAPSFSGEHQLSITAWDSFSEGSAQGRQPRSL